LFRSILPFEVRRTRALSAEPPTKPLQLTDLFLQQLGWVQVNGVIVSRLGSQVDPTANVQLLGSAQQQENKKETLLLNKPLGILSGQPEDTGRTPAIQLCTADREHFRNEERRRATAPQLQRGWAVAGRLDVNSTGLLVLTQQGRIASHLIGPDSLVEKEYLVRIGNTGGSLDSDAVANDLLDRFEDGIDSDGEILKAKRVDVINEDQLRFVLTQGKHHQIRRMCASVGWSVKALKRVRIGQVTLSDLPLGKWRYLSKHEGF
jgi:23S rRNA pseudouridine2604 synthase